MTIMINTENNNDKKAKIKYVLFSFTDQYWLTQNINI